MQKSRVTLTEEAFHKYIGSLFSETLMHHEVQMPISIVLLFQNRLKETNHVIN
jgi:hypothetical protein